MSCFTCPNYATPCGPSGLPSSASVPPSVFRFFFCLSNAYCARAVSQQRVKLLEPRCVYSTQGPGGRAARASKGKSRAGRGRRQRPAKGGKAGPKSCRRGKGGEGTSVYTRAREPDHEYCQLCLSSSVAVEVKAEYFVSGRHERYLAIRLSKEQYESLGKLQDPW